MKPIFYHILFALLLVACNTTKNKTVQEETKPRAVSDTITISNKEQEYEVIIIEPGFSSWFATKAKPKGFYSQEYLEDKNYLFINAWNARVLNPSRYDPNLYERQINYNRNIDYGYDVNYKLYNYFIYFQLKYKQQLSGFIPRN